LEDENLLLLLLLLLLLPLLLWHRSRQTACVSPPWSYEQHASCITHNAAQALEVHQFDRAVERHVHGPC
jgi:hypothetical protein